MESQWRDVLASPPSKLIIPTLDRRRSRYKKLGWLYILTHAGLKEKQLKIGMTARFPTRRALEGAASAAGPPPFRLVYYVHVNNRYQGERHAHVLLQRSGVSSSNDLYTASLGQAIRALDAAAAQYPVYLTAKDGQVRGVLPQDIQPRVVTCWSCGQKSRVRDLLIPTVRKCHHCGVSLD